MDFILLMHARLVITITLVFGVLSLWGLANHLRGRPTSRFYMAWLVVGQLLVITEFVFGVAALAAGYQPYETWTHSMYGVIALISVPAAYLYIRTRNTRWQQLIWALVCLFMAGIALRALETGHGPM